MGINQWIAASVIAAATVTACRPQPLEPTEPTGTPIAEDTVAIPEPVPDAGPVTPRADAASPIPVPLPPRPDASVPPPPGDLPGP
jgi:hypothetical protein